MFILDQKAFADNTTENIEAFAGCWSSFYNETPSDINGDPIHYRTWFAKLKIALEIKSELSTENIPRAKRLGDALMAFGQFPAKYVVD
jgi:hypothetical protein